MMTAIFKNFINYQRNPPIKNPKDDFCFDDSYRHFICHYETIEIIPDVILSNYQTAFNGYRNLKENYPNYDFWVFKNMVVDFDEFLWLILDIQTLENKLDTGDILNTKEYFYKIIYPKKSNIF